jgi:hypothetical protein
LIGKEESLLQEAKKVLPQVEILVAADGLRVSV